MNEATCGSPTAIKETIKDKIRWKFQDLIYRIKTVYIGIALKMIRYASTDSNILSHAKEEFLAIGYKNPDDKQALVLWIVIVVWALCFGPGYQKEEK